MKLHRFLPLAIFIIGLLSSLTAAAGPVNWTRERLFRAVFYKLIAKDTNKKKVPALPPEGFEQHQFAGMRDNPLHAWTYRQQDETRPVIVYFHGNRENIQRLYDWGNFDHLIHQGLQLFAYDYPFYGRSSSRDGGGHKLQGNESLYADSGVAAIREARRLFPQAPLVVLGFSLGGGVAISSLYRGGEELRQEVEALILAGTWDHLWRVLREMGKKSHVEPDRNLLYVFGEFFRRVVFGSDRGAKKLTAKGHLYSSARYVRNFRMPLLFIHSEDDVVVPYALGQQLYEAYPGSDKEFVTVKGAHRSTIRNPEAWQIIGDFIWGD